MQHHILMQNGELAAEVQNRLNEPISAHWHGLLVPGEHDGGPHLPIAPSTTWQPAMIIAQDPATIWYHSHIHERTAEQVYFGLAGGIHVTDGQDDARFAVRIRHRRSDACFAGSSVRYQGTHGL